ncbi:XdhC family protein [Natrinema longum]|uniref:XdhC family protein n=1 Tax=Natrinema longum TaxID=370324 RepID=A0A8A2U881_9EURY|nr:XdhC family protein [Natrinema longum]MBZ6493630.1 XdhC family protein [Natrinema longum]QSW85029.1 XdhC family protein [Natrinema longum]
MTADTPVDGDETETSDRSATATDGELAERERALQAREEPYARATVVRREPPVSATVGDHALVTADGDIHGWIGGVSCAQSRVVSEAQAAIADGDPQLIGLAPDPDAIDRPGLAAFPMLCHSEGTLEVFIEPVLPTRELLVVGGSPIAHSLVRLATELAVDVTIVDPDGADADLPDGTTVVATLEPDEIADAVGTGPFVVVASMGEYDARGVAAGMLADAPYVGLVASEARADEVVERAAGLLEHDPAVVREGVTNPAGVDISAGTAAELATSLLAELVEVRAATGRATAGADSTAESRAGTETTDTTDPDPETESAAEPDDESVVDPVCGMTVDPDGAPSVAHDGTTYYFCCPGCADSFRNDPDDYLASTDNGVLEST